LRASFRMFLFGENNSAIVSHGTRVKSGQRSAQVMRFQTGVIEVFLHAPKRGLDCSLQGGRFPDQATIGAFKPGRRYKPVHGSLEFAQAGNEFLCRLAFELSKAKGVDGSPGFRRCFLPPRFDTPLAQHAF
jgi:hypothetical protein